MIKKKAEANEAAERAEEKHFYDAVVTKAKMIREDLITFDMKVNGITIYGCWYREGVKDGKEWSMINLPSEKSADGKYYNKVWFPISNQLKDEIVEQLSKMI